MSVNLPPTKPINWPAWLLAIIPLAGFFIENMAGVPDDYNSAALAFAYILVNSVLWGVDSHVLHKQGLKVPNFFLTIIIPIYLWFRARRLKTSYNYFFAWWVSIFTIVALSYFIFITEAIPSAACPLVTDILKNQLNKGDLTCKVVTIDETVKDFHRGRAFLSNGSTIKIMVEERGDGMLYVTIPPQVL